MRNSQAKINAEFNKLSDEDKESINNDQKIIDNNLFKLTGIRFSDKKIPTKTSLNNENLSEIYELDKKSNEEFSWKDEVLMREHPNPDMKTKKEINIFTIIILVILATILQLLTVYMVMFFITLIPAYMNEREIGTINYVRMCKNASLGPVFAYRFFTRQKK